MRWISWLRRATPCSWAFEALLANEFRARILTCSSTDLIPSGPGYDDIRYQVCSINGAQPGSLNVAGMDYVNFVYGFEVSHVWRNVGILWAYFVGESLESSQWIPLASGLTTYVTHSLRYHDYHRLISSYPRKP